MRIERGSRAVSMAVAAMLSIAAGGGLAEANVAFCGGPIHGGWCDPIVDGIEPRMAGDPPYVQPADPATAARCLFVHVKGVKSVSVTLGAALDANEHLFITTFDGGGIPQGEAVGYIASKSLGAVTRDAVNGGMPHGVRIDDPALNGNPQAVVVASRAATPGASVSALGAWYDGQHWWLYNEDLAPMRAGETFFYAEGTGTGGHAVHTQANDYQGIGLYLDDVRLNGHPDAVVIPMHAFGGAYNASALGVWYDAGRGQWVVYNETGSALAAGQTIHWVTVP